MRKGSAGVERAFIYDRGSQDAKKGSPNDLFAWIFMDYLY